MKTWTFIVKPLSAEETARGIGEKQEIKIEAQTEKQAFEKLYEIQGHQDWKVRLK